RAKRKFSPVRTFTDALHVVEYPSDLGRGKVRVDHQPGIFAHVGFKSAFLQRLAYRGRSLVLPYDSVIHRLAGVAIPHYGRLVLVGDADGFDRGELDVVIANEFLQHVHLRTPYFFRIVLYPSGTWKNLSKLLLGDALDATPIIEQNSPGTGGSLVECNNVVHNLYQKMSKYRPAPTTAPVRGPATGIQA